MAIEGKIHAGHEIFRRVGQKADNHGPVTGIYLVAPTGYLMNKSELIESIATKTGSTRAVATASLDAALSAITEALAAGDSVAILGFGNFKVSERAARTGYARSQTGS